MIRNCNYNEKGLEDTLRLDVICKQGTNTGHLIYCKLAIRSKPDTQCKARHVTNRMIFYCDQTRMPIYKEAEKILRQMLAFCVYSVYIYPFSRSKGVLNKQETKLIDQ